MQSKMSALLSLVLMSQFSSYGSAERMPDKPRDATHVVTGSVQRVFSRETKKQIQYIVEIKVNQVERPASLMPGELLSVYCCQAKRVTPANSGTALEKLEATLAPIGELGHSAVPKEGELIRAFAKPRHGRLEGLYPNWFSNVGANPQEMTGKNAPAEKGSIGFHLLEKGKPISGVTSDEGWQLSESGKGPLSYVHIKPVFEITKDKVEKFSASPVAKITLTPTAATQLSQVMEAAKANSNHWFVMTMNGKKLNGRWNVTAFMNRRDIVVFSPNIRQQLGLDSKY